MILFSACHFPFENILQFPVAYQINSKLVCLALEIFHQLRLTNPVFHSSLKKKHSPTPCLCFFILFYFIYFILFFCLFAFSKAAPEAYGASQARGQIGAVAASLHHSSWQFWIRNSLSKVRDSTHVLVDTIWIH
mgnify:CR=1 FL=1